MSEDILQPVDAVTPESTDSTPHAPFNLEPKPVPPPDPKKLSKDTKSAKEKEDKDASLSPFSITVGQVYDGPLDLLLDLIRKQNIDIYDIPIGRITAQFLEYTHHLRDSDVDAAGEFIYTASLLIHIKSKMLLPRDPSGNPDAESEDPRRELVERLLEHERFKSAAQMLMQKQQVEEATWSNPGIREFKEDAGAEQEIAADTVDLVRVFQDVLTRLRARPVLDVDEESVTVAQMIDYVKRRLLMEDRPVSLRRMLHNTHTERALICMFLALLELVRLQAVLLHQPEQLGDILIKKSAAFDEIFEDQGAARDDWN
jgi:segregation and condensation protein A